MPSKTFFNLNEKKRNLIDRVLKEEFSQKPLKDANVKNIVEKLDIPRGSFYQYFDDLNDCYFYVLEKETEDVHLLFMSILKENNNDVNKTLEEFGERVCDLIFDEETYNIYKFRYLYWNSDLNDRWQAMKSENYEIFHFNDEINSEIIYFIKAIIHSLIERNFKENWSKEVFLKKYNLHIKWLMKGVENENIWEFVWYYVFVGGDFSWNKATFRKR